MLSGLIWISPRPARSRTLRSQPVPYFLASIQGTRIQASQCELPYSAGIAPFAQPIGQLL